MDGTQLVEGVCDAKAIYSMSAIISSKSGTALKFEITRNDELPAGCFTAPALVML
jgi:hypothetical protein